jgi:hypothetical protein
MQAESLSPHDWDGVATPNLFGVVGGFTPKPVWECHPLYRLATIGTMIGMVVMLYLDVTLG